MNSAPSPATSFSTTVRDFWLTRPIRPATGGKLGGVCAAFGSRYAVDPVLLRVALVVAALYGGVGVLLYLLAWMFLPYEAREPSGHVSPHTTSTPTLVVLAVLLVPTLFVVSDVPGVLGVLVCGGAIYLLHHNRAAYGPGRPGTSGRSGTSGATDTATEGTSPEAPSATTEDATTTETGPVTQNVGPGTAQCTTRPGSPAAPDTHTDTTAQPLYAGETASATPDAAAVDTDRFTAQPPGTPPPSVSDAAPHAEPAREPDAATAERPDGARLLTPVTLLLAALTTGGGLYLSLDMMQILAAVLGVLGLGMLAGSVLHRGRVLIVLAIPVALLAVAGAVVTQ